ncbi:hypothetical protein PENTCL1PPCAC_28281, partial [Pristionchus entomophagus]
FSSPMGASAQLVDPLDPTGAIKKMAIGASAAIISKTTTAPLDRVKLVLQVQTGSIAISKYNGMADCFSRITSDQGVLSLWRGNGASVLKCIPTHTLNFLLRDIYRGYFLRGIEMSDQWRYFAGSVLSGGVGGGTALFLLYPLDFARTRMAIDVKSDGTRRYTSVLHCLKRTRRSLGTAAWYRGFSSALQFVFVSRAVFFGLFDTIRTGKVEDQKNMSFLTTLALAQTCLIISGFTCYPFDTIRRRLMMVEAKGKRNILSTPSTLSMWKHVLKNEGYVALYRGVLPNTLRSSSGALIISLYYEISKYI